MGMLRIITPHKKNVCCRHIAEGYIIKYSCQFSFISWQFAFEGPPGLPKAPELVPTVRLGARDSQFLKEQNSKMHHSCRILTIQLGPHNFLCPLVELFLLTNQILHILEGLIHNELPGKPCLCLDLLISKADSIRIVTYLGCFVCYQVNSCSVPSEWDRVTSPGIWIIILSSDCLASGWLAFPPMGHIFGHTGVPPTLWEHGKLLCPLCFLFLLLSFVALVSWLLQS